MIHDIRTRLFDPAAEPWSLTPGGHPDLTRELLDQVANFHQRHSARRLVQMAVRMVA